MRDQTFPSNLDGVILVPFMPDGQVALIRDTQGGLSLPQGQVLPGEDPLLDAILRIPLMTAGFRMQHFHAFGARDSWITGWIDGDRYEGEREHVKADLVIEYPRKAARLFRKAGRSDLAIIVEAAETSRTSMTEDEYMQESVLLLEKAYLRSTTPEGGSGFGGTSEQWRLGREHITDGVACDGSFLDVGCANGLLMQSITRWAAERGFALEPYGIDAAPRLVEVARQRCPQWRDRLWVGNAIDWVHPGGMRFDFVHILLDFVRSDRRTELIRHLLGYVVASDGRLLVSHYINPRASSESSAAQILERLGFQVAGVSSPPTDRQSPTTWIDARSAAHLSDKSVEGT